MLKALWNSRAGLTANQNRVDIISNNIANVTTNGYKRLDVSFQDMFNDNMNRLGLPVTANDKQSLLQGMGSKAETIVSNSSQGTLMKTGREEDLAIEGNGFFRLYGGQDIDGNDKYYYTRDGVFNIDSNGNLANSSGNILEVEGSAPPQNIKKPLLIDETGNIMVDGKSAGKINLYDFVDRESLVSVGNNMFEGTGEIQVSPKIKQGSVEASNVDLSKELTDMMVTQRAFDLNSKSIKSADDMWQIANNLRSR
jgi:flagellar basal-body rod protein FlgG